MYTFSLKEKRHFWRSTPLWDGVVIFCLLMQYTPLITLRSCPPHVGLAWYKIRNIHFFIRENEIRVFIHCCCWPARLLWPEYCNDPDNGCNYVISINSNARYNRNDHKSTNYRKVQKLFHTLVKSKNFCNFPKLSNQLSWTWKKVDADRNIVSGGISDLSVPEYSVGSCWSCSVSGQFADGKQVEDICKQSGKLGKRS